MKQNIKAIIGLGNPGPRFFATRHNIGFRVLDELAAGHNLTWREQPNALVAEWSVDDRTVLLIKPQTFMNDSGRVIPPLRKKGIEPEQILVVHDELEKPFGTVTHRMGGSARGHNGLRSLIEQRGPEFGRVRVGIGRPADKAEVSDYVLRPFSEPTDQVETMITQAIDTVEQLIQASGE